MAHAIGFIVADKFLLYGIECKLATELPGELGGKTCQVRTAHDILVTNRSGPGFHTVKKVAPVARRAEAGSRTDSYY